EVPVLRCGPALDGPRLDPLVRTRAAAAGAGLGHVGAAGGGRAAGGPRLARVVDAERTADGAVAQVRRADVAVVGARRARRLDGVGGRGRAVARTRLLGVALVGRRAAHERGQLEGVVGTRAAAAGTRLGDVTPAARRRAARRPRVAGGVLADVARAVAEVSRADVAVVGAGRAVRLERARRRAAGARRAVVHAVVARLGAVDDPVAAIGVVEGQIDLAELAQPRGRRVRTVIGRQRGLECKRRRTGVDLRGDGKAQRA